ncbi:MAG TPA: hypothetical protein P5060_01845 [Candidatus Absconditabacterales bacterium]|nr:hypothetical protein [Candidatus Absconditabacterales bacterium]
MKLPVEVFDIDDVLFYLGDNMRDCIEQKNGNIGTLGQAKKSEWINLPSDEIYKIIEENGLYKNMCPTPILEKVKAYRNKMYLILATSRRKKYRDDTMEELDRHGLYPDNFYIGEDKGDICREERADDFYDDALHNIVCVQDKSSNTKTHLVKRAWNGPDEIKKFQSRGILSSNGIKRLTEDEVCRVLDQIVRN